VSGSGEFQLLMATFDNDKGLAADGLCCEPVGGADVGRCAGACRTFFRICLSHYQTVIQQDTPCTFGEQTTDVLVGGNSFQIPPSNSSSVGNPVRIPFSFTWPVLTNFVYYLFIYFNFLATLTNYLYYALFAFMITVFFKRICNEFSEAGRLSSCYSGSALQCI
jgi:hypothetical protein